MNALIMNAGYLLRSSYVHKKGSTFKIRVAEVGRLSANVKDAINSFVRHVIANSRQKTLFLRVLAKLQQ